MTKVSATDAMVREMLSELDLIPSMNLNELIALKERAASDFATYTLHAKQPIENQGVRNERAWGIRQQRAEASEQVWLAVTAAIKQRWEAFRLDEG